jgi:hypothetical protein
LQILVRGYPWMCHCIMVSTNNCFARDQGANYVRPRIYSETTSLFFLTSDYDCVHVKYVCVMCIVKLSVVNKLWFICYSCYLQKDAISFSTVKPVYKGHYWDLKIVAVCKSFLIKLRLILVVDESNWPLLTSGHCSQVVII